MATLKSLITRVSSRMTSTMVISAVMCLAAGCAEVTLLCPGLGASQLPPGRIDSNKTDLSLTSRMLQAGRTLLMLGVGAVTTPP